MGLYAGIYMYGFVWFEWGSIAYMYLKGKGENGNRKEKGEREERGKGILTEAAVEVLQRRL